MNPNEAAKLVVKKYPGRIPTGYWIRGDAVIINTRRLGVSTGIPAPAQFVVKRDGNVYGITPMGYDISLSDMLKF